MSGVLCSAAEIPSPEEEGVFRVLFIHHSVGSNWLRTDNGGLRNALEDPGLNDFEFEVHDATYGDDIGDDTDVCDWYPKFSTQMPPVLTFDYSPNHYYTEPGKYNHVVMFKSCYPASDIDGPGTPPGDPMSGHKTVWNYKAAYSACATIFQQFPNQLFVVVTAPPRNRNSSAYSKSRGLNAHEFNQWVRGEFLDEYYKVTGLKNIAVFDWFTDLLAEPETDPNFPGALKVMYSNGGDDSHPNKAANQAATQLFIPFINQAVREWRQFRGNKSSFRIAAPDSVYLYLKNDPSLAGKPYAVMGTVSGVYPGQNLGGGYHLPINMDAWTDWTLAYANCGFLPGFLGHLDILGESTAAMHSNKPLSPSLLGLVMHYVYVVHSPVQSVSNVVGIKFVLW
jgi:hypothetical protein